MTIVSLLFGTIAIQVLWVITKIVFIDYLNFDSPIIFWLFFIFITLETIAVVRRVGTLNLFESMFLTGIWLVVALLVDLVITTSVIGRDVYTELFFWLTYVLIIVVTMGFHKKAHVEARKSK